METRPIGHSTLVHQIAQATVALGFAICCALYFSEYSKTSLIFALAIAQLSPLILDLIQHRNRLLSLVLAIHFLYTCFAKIYILLFAPEAMDFSAQMFRGLQEQTICTVIILVVYHFLAFAFPEKVAEQYETPKKLEVPLPATGFFLGILVYLPWRDFLPSLIDLGPVTVYVHQFALVASITTVPKGYSRIYERLVPFLGLYLVFDFLNTLMMTYVALFYLAYLMSGIVSRDKRILVHGMVALLVSFLLQLAKGPLRSVTWYGDGGKASISDRVDLLFTVSASALELEGGENFEVEGTKDSDISALERVNEDILARVLDLTPDFVPFLQGQSYEQLLYIAVPRLLWPSKPSKFSGNTVGRLYGILGEEDFGTSISFPILAEGYANFGYLGLYLSAAITAILVFLAQALFPTLLQGNFLITYICNFAVFSRYEEPLSTHIYIFAMLLIVFWAGRFAAQLFEFQFQPLGPGDASGTPSGNRSLLRGI